MKTKSRNNAHFERKRYEIPEIVIHVLYHESSIAAGSAKVTVGNTGNSFSPFVDDWDEGGTRTSDFEM
ncbi:hypothetical protein [Sphingobacterium chungjuense]|uniref:hypothetical protein n=1 Tax=Sphingobacterium chungjuense TaxID=2675553 RepID=UPI00140AD046|nr:hypothetical protein [Sphingobacterium chungjuense]